MFTLGYIHEPGRTYLVTDTRPRARKPLDELADIATRAQVVPVSEGTAPAAPASALSVVDIPLNLIHTAKDLFQNRKRDFSARSVENIVNAVENGSFRWENLDPVILWQEPETDKLYILSGHSRTEAFKRLAEKGTVYEGRNFDYIPAKISYVGLEEAKEIARKSNTLSTKETDTERAAYYREKRESGVPEKDLKEEARTTEGKDANRILSLSFLNPNGRVIAALESTDEADQTTKNTITTVAAWIGSVRRAFPQLTDLHEAELYEWLIYNQGYGTRAGQISNGDTFKDKVYTLIMRNTEFGEFKADKPLNPRNLETKGPYELEYENRMKEAERELKEAVRVRDQKRAEFVSRQKSDPSITAATVLKALEPYEAAIILAQRNVLDLKKRAADVYAAEAAQPSLFGLGVTFDMKQTLNKNLSLHLDGCALAVKEMVRLGIPIDTALSTVKKESGLNAGEWKKVVLSVQRSLQIFTPSAVSLNGLGNPAYLEAAKIAAQVLGPVIIENAIKYAEQKKGEKNQGIGSVLPETKNVEEFIKWVSEGKKGNLIFGKPSLDFLQKANLNLEGYIFTISTDEWKHILKNHGNPDETKRGQIPVNNDDLFIVPLIVNSPDKIKLETGKRSINNLIIEKTFKNYFQYVLEIRTKRKHLAGLSLFIRKIKNPGVSGVDSAKKWQGPKFQTPEATEHANLRNIAKKQYYNNLPIKLGSVEVLQMNAAAALRNDGISFDGKPLYFAGFSPSYKPLPSYDHLIGPSDGRTVFEGDHGLGFVVEKIKQIEKAGRAQVIKLAKHLYHPDPQQAAFNVWHWLKTNIGYSLENDEQLRYPARSYADRHRQKIDCDDYAIFAAALLNNMGYKPLFKIVAFNGKENFQHIYVELEGVAVDPVLDYYGSHPSNITKEMNVYSLSGIPAAAKKENTKAALLRNIARAEANGNAAKARVYRYILSRSNKPEFLGLAGVSHLLADVDTSRGFIWKKDIKDFTPDEMEAVHRAADLAALGEVEGILSGRDSALEGLGRISKKERSARIAARQQKRWSKADQRANKRQAKRVARAEKKSPAKAAKVKARIEKTNRRKNDLREANKGVSAARRAGRSFARFDPLAVTGRNSFLAVVKLNFRGLATNMSWGILSDEVLQKNGLTPARIKAVRAAWAKLQKRWADMGGNPGALKDAIKTGYKKKPFLGRGKKSKAKGPKHLSGLGFAVRYAAHKGMITESFGGLGFLAGPQFAAIAAAAAAVIGALAPIITTITKSAGKTDAGEAAAEVYPEGELPAVTEEELYSEAFPEETEEGGEEYPEEEEYSEEEEYQEEEGEEEE